MILTCPECATRYQTDAAQFAPEGRKVRCAKCSHVWFQAPPAAESAAEAMPQETPQVEAVVPQRAAFAPQTAPETATASTEFEQRPRSRWLGRVALAFGWLALACILVVIGWSATRFRQNIATLWPQSSSLYKAVGMPVNIRGFEVKDKDAHFETEDRQDVLVITGHFANVTTHELSVPPIQVSLLDRDKRELYHWSFSPGVATLRAGQSAPFRTRLSNPPAAAQIIDIRVGERAN
jgi:predicted Zn finger-like uncharacterized protein